MILYPNLIKMKSHESATLSQQKIIKMSSFAQKKSKTFAAIRAHKLNAYTRERKNQQCLGFVDQRS